MAYEEEKEKLNHYSSELKKANDKLKYLASRDTLTKLYNRRAFDQEIKSIFINQSHRGKAISLILFDIDDFKSINDNYGHDIGDQVIIRLAELLKLDMPANSFISRWGGDEFAIIYSADLVKAEFYIKNLIYRIKILQSDELPFITISAGITELKSTDNIKSLFKRADNILYEAKESGKNNYILA
jgi:diguanylate cyclase (GGDEF)-like protein